MFATSQVTFPVASSNGIYLVQLFDKKSTLIVSERIILNR